MPEYTVISRTWSEYRRGLQGDPVAAIAGRHDAAGHDLHIAHLSATGPQEAMDQVRDAFRILGGAPDQSGRDEPHINDRWTVIGTADSGSCPSWSVLAVIPGEHKVEGRWDFFGEHRWDTHVDGPKAADADDAGYRRAGQLYNEAWH